MTRHIRKLKTEKALLAISSAYIIKTCAVVVNAAKVFEYCIARVIVYSLLYKQLRK